MASALVAEMIRGLLAIIVNRADIVVFARDLDCSNVSTICVIILASPESVMQDPF